MHPLALPLRFRPAYQSVVWGGRRLTHWRDDLPPGPVGESWELADHPRGMSIGADGRSLRELTMHYGPELVGTGFAGGDFPLLVKLIDASDRLSVQVHPDDRLARELNVAPRGKTESWYLLGDGGELFVGCVPGTTRSGFAAALQAGSVATLLNRFPSRDGDCFHLPARTVHALGAGCLICEVQQTCDTTFRVDDWGRVGLDGRPRPLHVQESLATIDYAASAGPVAAAAVDHPAGGSVRRLVACAYYQLEERRATQTAGGGDGRCAIVVCLAGSGRLATAAGAVTLAAMQTWLVPANAGPWSVIADAGADAGLEGLRLLVAQPVLTPA